MNAWVILVVLLVTTLGGAQHRGGGPQPGEVAPEFTLTTQDGRSRVTLSELKGSPTVLVFASYT